MSEITQDGVRAAAGWRAGPPPGPGWWWLRIGTKQTPAMVGIDGGEAWAAVVSTNGARSFADWDTIAAHAPCLPPGEQQAEPVQPDVRETAWEVASQCLDWANDTEFGADTKRHKVLGIITAALAAERQRADAAEARCRELEANRTLVEQYVDDPEHKRMFLQEREAHEADRILELEAACAAMRSFLHDQMWQAVDTDGQECCLTCDTYSRTDPHEPDCAITKALASSAGRDFLARLQAAERERDEARGEIAEALAHADAARMVANNVAAERDAARADAAKIIALCRRHASPASNTGAHGLALKILGIIEGKP